MKTKVAFFALALANVACVITSNMPIGTKDPAPQNVVQYSVSTQTLVIESSPTYTATATSIPPTETSTALPPTNTSTPLPPTAKVIGEGIVNVRIGPCNQPIILEANPGMEFIVTGRYVTPGKEVWWRVQVLAGSERLIEGWIWGGRVEVTNGALVPLVLYPRCVPMTEAKSAEGSQTITVNRWFHPSDKDWVTITKGSLTPAVLKSNGYQDKTFLFYAWTEKFRNAVAVYRWFNPSLRDWVTITEGTVSDQVLIDHGYQDKTFLFYASSQPIEDGIPVYRWYHPVDRDWVDIPEGSIDDGLLESYGYQKKTFLFYASTKP